ncbi:transcription termination/antitermination protein NusG [Bradyrhizobium sp. SYSU BS000235]|uniref:transcription termination/antitermination protein NusG n=1 Tax=Bradyrhizobium sp. SYSU BS000235 TaxID=3411332 RepID=UPI003C741486
MTADLQPRWFVVQTHSRAENKAVHHLSRQGFATYLPRYRKRRRHARKVDIVPTPLFPGYLFVAIDVAAQRWRSIASTVGIIRLVSNGSAPAPVPEQVVTILREREDEGGFVSLDQASQFSRGDRVRVVDGVFSSCLGLVDGMADGDRIAILLDLLGRKSRVILDSESVAAV